MKQLILLEQFILARQATNSEHRQAVQWLQEVQQYINQLESQVNDANDNSQ